MLLKALLFFNLVYVVNQLHFPFETGIPAVAPVNLLMLVIFLATLGKPDQLPNPQRPILLRPLLIWFAALSVAFVWAQMRAFGPFVDDLTYLKNALFFPLFYFVYLRCRQDEKTTRQLIICIMFVAAVAGLEAIREGFDYGFGKYDAFRRASGPFGYDWRNANRAGVFYAMFFPMFAALALFLERKPIWRLLAIGGSILMAGGALFTYSRQSYFIVLVGLALLLLRKSVIFAVIVGVALVSAVGFLPDSVTQRVEETKHETKHGGEEVDSSTASRWEIWAGAMKMLGDHPGGVGLARFPHEIGHYSEYEGYDAHNFYVLTFAECGPQGLLALLFLMGTLLFQLAAYVRKHSPPGDAETRALTLGFTVCTVCMALGGVYGSPTLEGSVMAPYWALCGLLERYVQLKSASKAVDADSSTLPPREAKLEERFPLAAYTR